MKKQILNRTWVLLLTLLLPLGLMAQTRSVRGVVTGDSGDPLPGVVIVDQVSGRAASTAPDGSYSIEAGKDAVLQFLLIGYKKLEVPVEGRELLNVILEEEITQLEDVVVIGYGQTTRKEVTGSVASVKSEDFLQGSNSSPYDLINGKIAGLSIIRGDGGDPNGGISIQLRGTTSMAAGATPLVIIDNVAGGNLESINPEEIESIDVLKDGSAAAIYGTRGTNGVILITTKKQ